jgi:hypothetical protein
MRLSAGAPFPLIGWPPLLLIVPPMVEPIVSKTSKFTCEEIWHTKEEGWRCKSIRANAREGESREKRQDERTRWGAYLHYKLCICRPYLHYKLCI